MGGELRVGRQWPARTAGWLLGAAWGGAAAGVGTMLADLFNGYAAYAPATLIIKFLMAAAAGLLLRGGQRSFPRAAAGAVQIGRASCRERV